MTPVQSLGPLQVLLLALPVAAVIGLSVALGLGQVRRISIATARSVVQLLAVGLVIGWVFEQQRWYIVTGLLALMTLIAGVTGARQSRRRVPGLGARLSLVLGGATAVTLIYLGEVVIGVPGVDPRYFIPLGGMLLGNAMTAGTLVVERLLSDLSENAAEVEAYLALGASPRQAVQPLFRRAIAAALTPTINAMMIVGVVKLPGMMTGQMLGGSLPMQAALYQLMILIGILFCDAFAATTTGLLLYRRFFTRAWQLDRHQLPDPR